MLDSFAKCYSIELRGKLCSNTDDERFTSEKHNDLLGSEPTTEPTSVYLCHWHRSRRPRALRGESSSVKRQLSFQKAFGLRQRPCLGQKPMRQDSHVELGAPASLNGPAGAGGETHYYGIATEALRLQRCSGGYAGRGDANRVRDDSDLAVRRGVWSHLQYSCPI